MNISAPLASGRDADVYALDDRLVLRRYRAGGDVSAEAQVMRHVAAHGYPVPAVSSARGSDLVMERIDGPTMLAALRAGQLGADEAGRILADLHTRLHAIAPREAGLGRVLHLDLHPDNVILGAHGPVVIDWRNTADGPAELDVALTAVILAVVAADDNDASAPGSAAVLAAFLATIDHPGEQAVAQALAIRRADPNLTAREVGLLPRAAARLAETR